MGGAVQQPRVSATAQRILEVAERLAQTRGFNGFSYADIAAELSITKASLHYHFASKADLGCALIVGYSKRFAEALAQIEAADPRDTLYRYVQLYENVLVRDRMCLCGMLAAEYSTLPDAMRAGLRSFFDKNESWLASHLERGRKAGTLQFDGPALELARMLTAGLEGAMLLARSYEEPARFEATAKRLLAEISGSSQRAGGAGRGRLPDGSNGKKASGRRRLAIVAVAMNSYELVSHWHFAAPIECIWDGLNDVQSWPKWWKYVLAVQELEHGDATGVGTVRRYTWGSRLPYRLTFSMRTTVVKSPQLLEGIAQGELTGMGRWTLTQAGPTTHVQYDWQVSTSRAWMNALAPLLAPMFRWNHGEVMAEGARGLARFLGVRQVEQ